MNIKVKLTRRDLVLLKDIYDNQFLSFYQIKEAHFKDNKLPTVYNRISKLIRAKYLESINVNLILYHRNNSCVGVIYRLTRFGQKELSNYFIGECFNQEVVSLNFSSMFHDLLLTDLLRIFKKRKPFLNCTNSKLITELKATERIPDAIIYDSTANKKVALELELTAKSLERYRDIIVNYRTHAEFDEVLYVVKDETIRNKIGGVITGFGGKFNKDDYTDKFKIILLKEIINEI